MNPTNHSRPLAFVTTLFFLFGFLTCMNDILVPHLKALFSLSYAEATLIQLSFFSSYFLFSIPAAKFCASFGFHRGMTIGLGIMSAGAFLILLSAKREEYPLFLFSFFVLAGGITLLQVSANPFVSLLGEPRTASSRLTLVQGFNSLGTTVAPLIGSAFILSNASARAIELPYLVFAIVLFFLAGITAVMPLPKAASPSSEAGEVRTRELLRNHELMFGVLAIFAYVGGEVAIGSFLINWIGTTHVMGFSPKVAGNYVAFYWGGAMVGRFIGTALLARFAPPKVLMTFIACALLGIATTVATNGAVALWSILSVGFFNSILFPTIFSESIAVVERGAEKASGLLCTAIVGGAVIPVLQGLIADGVSLEASFALPFACYLYLFYFANRLRRRSHFNN